jgi:glycosyltransferase involved in cell wall biosynthesis
VRVLILEPYPGWRWVSIHRFAETTAAILSDFGVDVTRASAPWWGWYVLRHPSAAGWRRAAAVRAAMAGGVDTVLIADVALAHHAPLFRRTRVVVAVHGLLALDPERYWAGRLERVTKPLALKVPFSRLRAADALLAVSGSVARDVRDRLAVPPARIRVVPNALPGGLIRMPREVAEETLARNGHSLPGGARVLSVGHTVGYKNLPLLIDAMSEPRMRGAVLVRVGERFNRQLRQKARALIAEGRLVELGPLSGECLSAAYSACDVLAQPSVAEGFGYPVIEAQACGLPVVCSDGGALPEIAGNGAVVISLASADPAAEFAGALARVLGESELAERLRLAGYRNVERFAPSSVGPLLIEALAP